MKPKEKTEEKKNIIGKQVVKVRRKQGLLQKDLVARLQVAGTDISASGLSKLEGQTRQVTDIELVAIAAALHVSTEELLKGKEKYRKI